MAAKQRRPPSGKGGRQDNAGATKDSATNAKRGEDGTVRGVVAEYLYVNEDGSPNRLVRKKANKDFPQFSPNGKGGWKSGLNGQQPVLYRLPEVIAAVERGEEVWITEGEKDADAARERGVTATTNPGGAGKWSHELSDYLIGARVNVVWDQDDPGAAHARKVVTDLLDAGVESVTCFAPLEGNDLSDHLDAGFGLDDLEERDPPPIEPTPERTPESKPERRRYPAMYIAVRGLLADFATTKYGKELKSPTGPEQKFKAFCPAHDDKRESLSVRLGDEQAVVLHCHAGCEPEAVVDALGLDWTEFGVPLPANADSIEREVEAKLAERERAELVAERLKERELDLIAEAHPEDREAILDVLREYTKAVKLADLPALFSNDDILSRPPVRWTVDGWVQEGDLTNIYSPPGSGKTLVSESLKEAISHGSDWQGWPTIGGAVLVLSAEGVAMLRARIEAVRASRRVEPNERSRHTEEAWDVTTLRGLARLVRAVLEVGRQVGSPVVAVLVDPADEYSPERGPEGVEHTKGIALALRSVARGLGVGVVLFHHTNAAGERGRGTEHLRMYAAGHIRLDRINDDVIGLVAEKQRNGVERAMKLNIIPTGPSVTLNATEGRGGDGEYLKTNYLGDKKEAVQQSKARAKVSAAHDPALRAAIMKVMPASQEEARERRWSKNKATSHSDVAAISGSGGTRSAALDGLVADGFVKAEPVEGDRRGTILCWKVRELPKQPTVKAAGGHG